MTEGEIKTITPDTLLIEAMRMHHAEWRLIQISARKVKDKGETEITYSFGKDLTMAHLRFQIGEENIPSISHIYASAFLYENEMHDLFGICIEMMTLDYQGHFYRLGRETPFKE